MLQWGIIFILIVGAIARGPPIIKERVEPRQIVRAGETLKLTCPVDSNPDPLRTWSKDGENIHAGWERFKVSSDGQNLRIKTLMTDDSGRYMCRAVNGFGSVDIVIRLWVHPDVNETLSPPAGFWDDQPDNSGRSGEMPQFSKPEQMTKHSYVLPIGAPLRLRCRANGRPKPSIIWYKDGKLLPDAEIEQRSGTGVRDEESFTLKLDNLQESDDGSYTCNVFNRVGAINFTYTVDVIDRLSKPVITDPHPYNISVVYGQTASFECNVHSAITPNIQWLKRVDSISDIRNNNNTIDAAGQQFVVLKTGPTLSRADGTHANRLTIYESTDADAGMYICLAANSMGYNNRSAFLTIKPNPNLQNHKGDGEAGNMFSSLPVILAISAVIIAIILIAAICLICRQNNSNNSSRSSAGSPNSTKSSSVLRQPLQPQTNSQTIPHHHPLQRHMLSNPQEKLYVDHQYAAIHPQLQPFLPPQQQQQQHHHPEHLYHHQQQQQQQQQQHPQHHHQFQDMHSDVSGQKSVSPLPPPTGHIHIQPPQHTHIHYNMT